MNRKQLVEKRAQLDKDSRKILAKAGEEERLLTAEESAEWDRLDAEIEDITSTIDVIDRQTSRTSNLERSVGRRAGPERGTNNAETWVDSEGQAVPVLTPDENLSDLDGGAPPLSFGKLLRGQLTNKWGGADAEREFSIQASAAGGPTGAGYTYESPVASWLIDLARAKSVVMRAGARTVPMTSSELSIARLTADPTAYWRHPGTTITEDTTMAIGQLQLTAKTLACIIPVQIELLEDAPNIGQIIDQAMAAAMALKLDYAALRGGQAGNAAEPVGLRSDDNVPETDAAGSISFSIISNAVEDVWDNNGEPNALIAAPRTFGEIDRFLDGDSQPVLEAQAPKSYRDLLKLRTSQIPTNLGAGTNETEVYVGDFSQLLMGIRSGFRVEVLRSDNDSVSKMLVKIRAYLRADVGIARPNDFVRIVGIEPAA